MRLSTQLLFDGMLKKVIFKLFMFAKRKLDLCIIVPKSCKIMPQKTGIWEKMGENYPKVRKGQVLYVAVIFRHIPPQIV